MVGMSMLGVAIAWLVYARTASVLLVGLAITLQYLPLPAGRPFARLLLTSVSQRRILLGTQTLFCCIAGALFVVTFAQPPTTRAWALLLFSLLWGCVRATDAPVRHAFLVDLVGRRDLTYGLSLVASAWNVASFAGAALAGVLLFWLPPAVCFVAVLIAMLAGVVGVGVVAELPTIVSGDRLWRHGAWQSLRQCARSPRVVALIVLGCAFSALGMNRLTLLTGLFAVRLGAGAIGFGLGVAMVGLGATVGGAVILWNARAALTRSLLWPGLIWAVAMAVAGWSAFLPLTLASLAVTGAMQTWLLGIVGQRLVDVLPDRERGPVMGLYAWFAVATNWIGPLQAGLLALVVGVPLALSIDAALLVGILATVALAGRGARSSSARRETTSAAR